MAKQQRNVLYGEVMQFAINKEQEAVDLYSGLARRTKNPGGKIMFTELADMEKGHKAKLEKLDLGYFKAKKLKTPENLKISDYLVDVQLAPDSSYQDILLFAAKRERAAFDLYTDLSTLYASTPEIKKMFDVLAQEEALHKLKLEREYDDNVYKEG
jgi:rubrerythrin